MAVLTTLLRIESQRLLLELIGPQVQGLNAAVPATLTLRTTPVTQDPPQILVQEQGPKPHAYNLGDTVTAFLQEESAYTLSVRALVGDQVQLTTRDERIFSKVRSYGGNPTQRSGEFSFTRQVGRFEFSVSDGQETWNLELEVFPSKLDYKIDYRNLVQSLETNIRALALANFRATHRPASATPHTLKPGEQVEWLTLIRHYVDDLESALDHISRNPHRTLRRRQELTRAERVAKVDVQVAKQIARGRGAGAWEDLDGTTRVKEKIWNAQVEETVDNSENRHIKRALERVVAKLREIRQLAKSESNAQHPQLNEIDDLVLRVSSTLTHVPFPDVTDKTIRMGASLALVQKPGYREAYQILRALMDLILIAESSSIKTSVKDLDALYEAWAFIHAATVVVESMPGARLTQRLKGDGRGRLGVTIARGASVVVESKTRNVQVIYNRETPGLTGGQRPDITVVIEVSSLPHIDIVIDAKYRVRHTDAYIQDWGSPGPPRDATDACHRYRDSIIDPVTNQRHTVRAVAVFPLGADEGKTFVNHDMFKAVNELGVGALPLLPGNTALFDAWLTVLLAADPGTLATFGPPHAMPRLSDFGA